MSKLNENVSYPNTCSSKQLSYRQEKSLFLKCSDKTMTFAEDKGYCYRVQALYKIKKSALLNPIFFPESQFFLFLNCTFYHRDVGCQL